AVGRAGPRRAVPPRAAPAGPAGADRHRAAGRGPGRFRAHQPAGRGGPVPQPADGGGQPRPHLPQAGDLLPARARRGRGPGAATPPIVLTAVPAVPAGQPGALRAFFPVVVAPLSRGNPRFLPAPAALPSPSLALSA